MIPEPQGKWDAIALVSISIIAIVVIGTMLLLSLAEHMVQRIALEVVCRSLVEAKLVTSCGLK